jgi:hypothetical protein
MTPVSQTGEALREPHLQRTANTLFFPLFNRAVADRLADRPARATKNSRAQFSPWRSAELQSMNRNCIVSVRPTIPLPPEGHGAMAAKRRKLFSGFRDGGSRNGPGGQRMSAVTQAMLRATAVTIGNMWQCT